MRRGFVGVYHPGVRRSSLRSALGFVSLVASAVACGDAPPPQPVTASVPAASAAAQVATPSLPDTVADLGAIVPGDASFVVELPSFDKLGDLVPVEQRAMISMLRPFAEGGAADKLGLESSVVHALVDGIERATIFGDVTSAAVVARFRDRVAVEKLVLGLKPIPAESAPGVREVYSPAAAPALRVVWHPRPRILVWATSAAAAQRVERTGSGETASFAKNPRRLPDDAAAIRVYADLASLVAKDPEASRILERGSSVRADVGYDGKRAPIEDRRLPRRQPHPEDRDGHRGEQDRARGAPSRGDDPLRIALDRAAQGQDPR